MSHDQAVPIEPRAEREDPVWNDGIGQLTVDGVPVFWADTPGPLRAALTFRVGTAHEELPWRGVTHLVEHLALNTLGRVPYQFNGAVEYDSTRLEVTGTEEDVCSFLATATRALAALPLDGLERERSVLLAEAETRPGVLSDLLLHLRFGWTGHGLAASEEFGLRRLSADRVAAWAARHFTAGNAALCLSGPPPQDLRLHLPTGPRIGGPVNRAIEQVYPAGIQQQNLRQPTVSFLGERSLRLVVAMHILERRLHDRLRREHGVSYHVGSSYIRLDETRAHMLLSADARAEHLDTAIEQMLASVDELAAQGATAEELAFEHELASRSAADPHAVLGELNTMAMGELTGWPRWSTRDVRDEIATLRGDEIAKAMQAAARTALWVVPAEATIPEGRMTRYAQWSSHRLNGRTVAPTPRPATRRGNPVSLTLGDEGITLTLDEARVVTVRYADCAAMQTWTNGDRQLQGRDGFRILVKPVEWQDGPGLVSEIDRHVDPALLIDMGDPAPLPPVPPSSPAQLAAAARRRRLMWLNLLVVGICWLIVIGGVVGGSGDPTILALGSVITGWRTYLLVRAWRGRRSPLF